MAEASSENETPRRTAMASDSYTLFSFVDEVESRVDALRRQATALMGEQASLLMILEQLKNDCMVVDISSEDSQELLTNMQRLKARCEAVEIQVRTVRDEGQLQSLQKVNNALEELQGRLVCSQSGSGSVVLQARSYLNACLPEALGPIDSRFQSMVLGCAVDDQKDIRRRLEGLVREWSQERKGDSTSRRNNSNDNSSKTGLSENSARLAESVSSQERTASSPLPSNVTYDERRSEQKEAENHLSPEWFLSPKDAVSDKQSEDTERRAKDGGTGACDKDRNSAGFDSSS